LQLDGCSDDENLRFLGIELQAVLQVPQPDVSGAGGEEGKTCPKQLLHYNRT